MAMSDKGGEAAYMIVSGTVLHPDRTGAYADAARPVAEAAGHEFVTVGAPRLLEGNWPHGGAFVVVERFTSMDDLLGFWNSEEYQQAKKLREGVIEIDFVIAIEAEELADPTQDYEMNKVSDHGDE